MAEFKSLFHVSLHVKNARESTAFYEKIGLKFMFELNADAKTDEPWVVYMRIAHGQYLEIQSVNAKTPEGIPDNDGISIYSRHQTAWHFALETDDLSALISDLIAQGISVWTSPDFVHPVVDMAGAIYSDDGCRVAWICDPDGTPIELMEQVGQTQQRIYDPA